MNLFKGAFIQNEPMSKRTSWRCGGNAAYFFEPVSIQDLSIFLSSFKENKEIFWIGLGSNLLVRDEGFDGIIISTAKFLNKFDWEKNLLEINVECGVSCAKIARETAKKHATGLEFFAGIPGTIGGALEMNAGAHGCDTWQSVKSVDVISRDGSIKRLYKNSFNPGYRKIDGDNGWFVRACFQLKHNNDKDGLEKIKMILSQRKASQPIGSLSCGSVFINPKKSFAGQLIEECGLKGFRVGGALISEKHANFILNDRGATASDIEKLINIVKYEVFERTGITLECEVKIIGKRNNGE